MFGVRGFVLSCRTLSSLKGCEFHSQPQINVHKSQGQNEVHQAEFIAYQSIGQTSEKDKVLVNVLLRKAEEYLRLSHVKCVGLSARTTETSNAVMCLDLAASCMKCPLDRVSRSQMSELSGVALKSNHMFSSLVVLAPVTVLGFSSRICYSR